MRLFLVVLVVLGSSVAVVQSARTFASQEEEEQFFTEIFERTKQAVKEGLETVRTFGPIERVSDFIKDARDKLRDMISHLRGDQKLKEVAVVAPMHGWVYEVPPDLQDLTVDEFKQRLGSIEVPKDGGESQAALETEAKADKWYDPRTWFGSDDRDNKRVDTPAPTPPPVVSTPTPVVSTPVPDTSTPTPVPLPASYLFYDAYPKCKARPWNQGNCGSCWAFSNAASLGYRLCRKMVDAGWKVPTNFRISPQQFISCVPTSVSPDGNGCNGGITVNAASWIAGRGNAELTCMAATQDNNPHKDRCAKAAQCSPLWGPFTSSPTFSRLDYLPQARIENAMMRAIFDEGPIVINVRIPAIFMGYSGKGVFRKGPKDAWLLNAPNPDGTPNHANHAMIIVGWGVETNGDKYWVVENSWGEPYSYRPSGLRHTIKWLRGNDECLIESMGVSLVHVTLPAADPHASEPQNECERRKRGASCMSTSACSAAGRHIARGLCPGSDTCCLAPGQAALEVFSKRMSGDIDAEEDGENNAEADISDEDDENNEQNSGSTEPWIGVAK